MANLNTLIANLNQTIRSLSQSAEITQQQMLAATEKTHDLLEELKKSAREAKLRDLEEFLNRIQAILSQLHQVAQEPDPSKARNLVQPNEILQQLATAYEECIVPMVKNMQNNPNSIQKASMIASLGQEVFTCCKDLNTYRPNMNRKETVCAVLGTVLMFAGIGMLIAATVNPATLPIVAGIAVITLGCYLAKKAVERHKNAQADKINESLDKQLNQIEQISKNFGMEQQQRESVRFTAAQACSYEPQIAVVPEPKQGLMQRIGQAFNNFFKFRT